MNQDLTDPERLGRSKMIPSAEYFKQAIGCFGRTERAAPPPPVQEKERKAGLIQRMREFFTITETENDNEQ